ncbi:hypothetical protein MP228_013108 [Amoeboaphelidium protococcarum]|nr:hypothetical protein MP228_013108 [Amoeboaphelidium protococcarum]
MSDSDSEFGAMVESSYQASSDDFSPKPKKTKLAKTATASSKTTKSKAASGAGKSKKSKKVASSDLTQSSAAHGGADLSDNDDDEFDSFVAPQKKSKPTVSKVAKTKSAPKSTKSAASKQKILDQSDADDDQDGGDSFSAEVEQENVRPAAQPTASNGQNQKSKTIEEIYQKKSQLEHILLRPDTYIGSVESIKQQMWVWEQADNEHGGTMVFRDISYVPGFYKIFDEILVNAADNKQRDPSMDVLKVVIDKENGVISVHNNGKGIPIEIHAVEKVYVPELIFGHLLTSSNYDDNDRKVTGGRNGYGAKLCNIFSTEFIVETADKVSGRKYKQVFSKNMSVKGEPKLSSNSREEEYTKITFKPDFGKFGMDGIDHDIEALLQKRVVDMAGCLKNVKVYLNDQRIKIKNFRQYVDLFVSSKDNNAVVLGGQKPVVVHEIVNDRWEVAFTLSEGQFQQVSFVNSISTSKGGTHVNHVADTVVSKIIDAIQKKNKAAPVKSFQIKNQMWLFINCLIENPAFDSQTKENMTLKSSQFGSKCAISDEFVNKVKKSGLIENVLHWAKSKQDLMLKKTDGSKRIRIAGITKLDDANKAGSKDGSKCTLIVTEGDSAKTLAVTGLGVIGRDYYGVFPLRGKLLNVREATHKQIMENAEINNIKQIMGLQHGKKYTDTSTLRYGHLMIMTDQDHDGSHIKGLILNFLDHFFPELLHLEGFLCEFITPIVKATKGKNSVTFYTIPEYEQWLEETDGAVGWNIKYYKGLGTSTKEDAKQYFLNLAHHKKEFGPISEEERDMIDMAFNKKKTDNRKEWLRAFKPGTFIDHSTDQISVSDFINKELILFSMADNIRSIPNVVDGLKPGLRKIVYACFKRNLVKGEIKVAQLSGYVAEHSAYHHGEVSLQSSIVGLAQNFVGSNNINLLEPIGQFGSRLQGGKDAASARYIFTRLTSIARKIFHKFDDNLLNYLTDDGQKIEPDWYIPVMPLLLVNGGEGIGTGWSCSIPNYNPRDIVENLKRLMLNQEMVQMHPWYRGFHGDLVDLGNGKYNVCGKITKVDATTLEITELPVRFWTQTYKEFLESLLSGNEKTPAFIKDYKEYHSDSTVHFVIHLTEANMAAAEKEGLEKKFKMVSSISTSNMVCFDPEGRIKKYANALEILQEFYHLRLQFYQKRKEFLADQLTQDWTVLDNKVRFIMEIIQGKLVVQNRKKNDIIAELQKRDYKPMPKTGKKAADDNADDSEDESGPSMAGSYDYLLSMAIWSLTAEKVTKLKEDRAKKQQELDELLATGVKDLWIRDLNDFMDEWNKMESDLNEADLKSTKGIQQAGGAGKKGKKGASKSKAPAKKKVVKKFDVSDDDDDDEDDTEESEDDSDFMA